MCPMSLKRCSDSEKYLRWLKYSSLVNVPPSSSSSHVSDTLVGCQLVPTVFYAVSATSYRVSGRLLRKDDPSHTNHQALPSCAADRVSRTDARCCTSRPCTCPILLRAPDSASARASSRVLPTPMKNRGRRESVPPPTLLSTQRCWSSRV